MMSVGSGVRACRGAGPILSCLVSGPGVIRAGNVGPECESLD